MSWERYGPPPPWFYMPPPVADKPRTLGEQLKDLDEGIRTLKEWQERLKKEEKKDDKKKPEGLSKASVFWLMFVFSPVIGFLMANIYLQMFIQLKELASKAVGIK